MEDQVWHERYGTGILLEREGPRCRVRFDLVGEKVVHETVLSRPGASQSKGDRMGEIKALMRTMLEEWMGPAKEVKFAERWQGGNLILRPKNPELKEKEIPLDRFFRKIVLIRERLRLLEQNLNNHPKLEDGDRIELQQYITKIYGSLTTFNALFQSKEDHFVGEKKEEDHDAP